MRYFAVAQVDFALGFGEIQAVERAEFDAQIVHARRVGTGRQRRAVVHRRINARVENVHELEAGGRHVVHLEIVAHDSDGRIVERQAAPVRIFHGWLDANADETGRQLIDWKRSR